MQWDWHQKAAADYRTNGGGSTFTRPSSAPSRSDTVLVTSTEYNDDGKVWKVFDPVGTNGAQTRVTGGPLGFCRGTVQEVCQSGIARRYGVGCPA